MTIQWLGHSCFHLKSKSGISIVTDPYDSYIGQKMPSITADIVTVSHSHDDHSATENISGTPIILDKYGVFETDDISIYNIKTYHDDKQGSLRGDNLVFVMTIDEIRVCHLGDIGEKVSQKITKAVFPVDILLIPVGGKYTIDAQQAKSYVEHLTPKVIVPMHHKTKNINIDIAPVNYFLELFPKKDIEYIDNNGTIEFTRPYLKELKNRVIVFSND